jgi:stress response protein SCP2
VNSLAISLEKGQRIDLTKGKAGLSKILVGLGWDPVASGSGGFFGKLFGGGTPNIDCDASVLMLENGRVTENKNVIYFGNLRSRCGSIEHTGDNLTGEGSGDDEQIIVDLQKVPSHIHKLVFVVNIYDCVKRSQHFGMIENAFIRIVNMNDRSEMVKYNLRDDYSGRTSLIAGEIYRDGAEWKFTAVGEGTNDTSITEIVKRYA